MPRRATKEPAGASAYRRERACENFPYVFELFAHSYFNSYQLSSTNSC